MRPQDYFGLVLRILGLAILCVALLYLYDALAIAVGIPLPGKAGSGLTYFSMGVITLAIGLYLLRGAPALVRFAYPAKREGRTATPPSDVA